MPVFTVMVGIAGSGKSTIAARIAEQTGAIIVSSDLIRKELYGDENCQDNPTRVFDLVHRRIKCELYCGNDVIMDATNLSCKRRIALLKSLAHLECEKHCVVVITTPEDIAERMEKRERKVPMEVVHKQLCQFQCPNYYEGWDKIEVCYNSTLESCQDSYWKLWAECDIPHDNPHHSLSVMEHMNKAADIAEEFVRRVDGLSRAHERWVALVHDVGKPRCKSFTDRKGNSTEIAHYYGHQNYGAYYSLLFDNFVFDISEKDSLDNACLIQWHMEHYLRKGSALERFYEMIGPELSRRLHILEEADKAAH